MGDGGWGMGMGMSLRVDPSLLVMGEVLGALAMDGAGKSQAAP
jgi:hypothetical protein